MGEYFNRLDKEVQNHISRLMPGLDFEDAESGKEQLAAGWFEKLERFHEQTKHSDMEECESIELEDTRAALILTYSGSLISLGPDIDAIRSVDYVSIGLRSDVPESASNDSSVLSSDIVLGKPVEFSEGPIEKSSPVYAIAVLPEQLSSSEATELLEEVTMMVSRDFTDINRTLVQ